MGNQNLRRTGPRKPSATEGSQRRKNTLYRDRRWCENLNAGIAAFSSGTTRASSDVVNRHDRVVRNDPLDRTCTLWYP